MDARVRFTIRKSWRVVGGVAYTVIYRAHSRAGTQSQMDGVAHIVVYSAHSRVGTQSQVDGVAHIVVHSGQGKVHYGTQRTQ